MKRFITVGLLLAALTAGVLARQDPGPDQWSKDPVSGIAVWNEDPLEGEVISWSGGSEDGKASGAGVLVCFAGRKLTSRYEGPMRAGRAEGAGRLAVLDEGEYLVYEGQFADGKLNGIGIVTAPDGSRLEATFRDNRLDGPAVFEGADGRGFSGTLVTDPDGTTWKGTFTDDEPDGTFTVTKPDGTTEKRASSRRTSS